MREWAERRGEVLAAVVATVHFVRERGAEWRHLFAALWAVTGDGTWRGWRYLGTWFHPHLGAWVHDLRYREPDGGAPGGYQVCLRIPASPAHRPPHGLEELARVESRMRRLRPPPQAPQMELVISAARGRAFAVVSPLADGPTLWRCVRETLFPAREEQVVLH
jgi:hypothetical protein